MRLRPGGRRSPGIASGRSGMAVAVVLLVTLALFAMAHASLLLARTESLVARYDARRIELAYRAAAALAEAEANLDALPGDGGLATAYGLVSARRLSSETAVLTARPGLPGAEGRGRVLFAPDPDTRVRRRPAGIVVGEAVIRSAESRTFTAAASCTPAPGPIAVWIRPASPDGHPGLGPVPLEALLERLPLRSTGTLLVDSTFVVGVDGNAAAEGSGEGVLAVQGDLVVTSGASVRGWVWVGGDLTLEPGSRLSGFADVGGTVRIGGDAVYEVDACAARRAISGAFELRTPWGVGPLAWPAF